MKTTDRRSLAGEIGSSSRAYAEEYMLPDAKALTQMASSLAHVRKIVQGARLVQHTDHEVSDGILFTLEAQEAAEIRIPKRKGDETGTQKIRIKPGDTLGQLFLKVTKFFPNELIDELSQMKERGASQKQMHEHMSAFYKGRRERIPTWDDVVKRRPLSGGFDDESVFIRLIQTDMPMTGTGITEKMIPEALEWMRKTHPNIKYALVYTRMATLNNTLQRPLEPMKYDCGFKPATLAEAQEHLELNAAGERPDWSIDFHRKLMGRHGGKILFAMDCADLQDTDSLFANALGIYPLQTTFK